MQTRMIPEDKWVEFCDTFSRTHLGWTATIEVLDRQTGPMNVAANVPLQGMSFDVQGTRPSALDIAVGGEQGRHVHHVIDKPLFIRQMEDTGEAVDLQIEPAEGPITLLHVRGPVH